MAYVNVVPLRRLPADRQWLTYTCPATMTVAPGQLVSIPLRGRQILGIVWQMNVALSGNYSAQEISQVHFSGPIITPWMMRVSQAMADTGATSLTTVLMGSIPKLTLRGLTKYFSEVPIFATIKNVPASPDIFWYRNRQQAIQHLLEQARASEKSKVILSPTVQDIQAIADVFAGQGQVAEIVHSKITPTAIAKLWQRLICGERLVLVGTLRALSLPFPSTPTILLDQEEHIGHKQTAAHPRYDTLTILRSLQATASITSSAPTLLTYRDNHPIPPPVSPQRQIASLNRDASFSWFTEEARQIINDTLAAHQRVICIGPRRGFASTTLCQSCQYVQRCPICGQRATLFRGVKDDAVCQHCHSTVSLHAACPNCGGTRWAVRGLGIEQIVAAAQALWPENTVAPIVSPDVLCDIAVDTYQAYHHLQSMKPVGAIILVSGDSLLNIPDYSATERAWQFLSRLEASSPTSTILVQTFDTQNVFWQRWLHSDDRAWYENELADRHRLGLPPFTTQWIARYRGPMATVEGVQRALSALSDSVSVTRLPVSQKHPHRLLLTFLTPEAETQFAWSEYFPYPWQVDFSPRSWLD